MDATHPIPVQARPDSLPRPEDRPAADVVIYDGDCSFCTAGVKRLSRWDRRGRLSFLSLQDPETARRWPELTHDYLMQNMVVVEPSGKHTAGADAFRHLAWKIPMLYVLAPLMSIPGTMPLWRWAYRQFAKIRYRFGKRGCEGGACAVHFK